MRFKLITKTCFIALVFLLSCEGRKEQAIDSPVDGPTPLELEYLEKRDAYDKVLRGDPESLPPNLDEVNQAALEDLEGTLREILAGSALGNSAKINLQTMLDEVGVDMLDGLFLQKDSSTSVFVTTRFLFNSYFSEMDSTDVSPESLEKVFNATFISDADVANAGFTRFEVNGNQAYGMVAIVGQDIGPFTPDFLFVFVPAGNRIYMAAKWLDKPLSEIPECKMIWDKVAIESEKAMADYQASGLKDTTALNRRWKMEDNAWKDYCACYRERLEGSEQFNTVKDRLKDLAASLWVNR